MFSNTAFPIVNVAAERIDLSHLSQLERLPNELKIPIIGALPDMKSLFNLALSGPGFYAFIAGNEGMLATEMVTTNIDANVMSLAVARRFAAKSAWKRKKTQVPRDLFPSSEYVKSVTTFVDEFLGPQNAQVWTKHLQVSGFHEASCYLALHNAICHYAKVLSGRAMKRAPMVLGYGKKVSSTVLNRYKKALYIMQLVTDLFSWSDNSDIVQYQAWTNFWTKFAPWELEQVRCLEVLLGEHFEAFIAQVNEESVGLLSSTLNVAKSLRGKFIVRHGPEGLWDMELRSSVYIINRAFHSIQMTYVLRCRPHTYHREHSAIWLDPNQTGHLSLDASEIFATYGEDEPGPMKIWYYTLLQRYIESPIVMPGIYSYFSCARCMARCGYAFWDDIKSHRRRLPTISEMRQATLDAFIDEEGFREYVLSRSHVQYCNCDRGSY
ncbi:hypothetical protein F5Y19DRAFT_488353 [Xylariaceae sp. FL1651]|nr:hypothetical protein F5Y19DRAFT_488353 [Xylariaceae sp. FL1651]